MARGLSVVAVVGAAGCVAGPQVVLEQPVGGRCEAARLRSCEDLTRGAILYAQGDPASGRAALARGLAANSDRGSELHEFAASLITLGSDHAAGRYVASLRPAVALILQAAAAAQTAAAQAAAQASMQTSASGALAPASDRELASLSKASAETYRSGAPQEEEGEVTKGQPLGGFLAPTPTEATPQDAGVELTAPRACALGDGTRAWCVSDRVMARGYVTELMVSAGCVRDVFVLTGPIEQPAWLVWVPAGRGLSEHGLHLLVQSDAELVAGVVAKKDDRAAPSADFRCGVTWVGTAGK